MFFVICNLYAAAALGFVNGAFHGVGNAIGIHDNLAVCVSRGTPNRLNKRAVIAQKALFIGIKNSHQRHFWQVEALAQQVNANKHVKYTKPQVTQNFHTLKRTDIRVHVARFQPAIKQMIRQILRHFLGKRGNKRALVAFRAHTRFIANVVNLRIDRAHFNFRV